MTKPNNRRKTRSDKFPLTLHKTGQYCKKIKGRLYYFYFVCVKISGRGHFGHRGPPVAAWKPAPSEVSWAQGLAMVGRS